MENELKINARRLTAPGPRLMVEAALAKGSCRILRVVVSDRAAADDLEAYASELGAAFKIDQVGDEFHLIFEFGK